MNGIKENDFKEINDIWWMILIEAIKIKHCKMAVNKLVLINEIKCRNKQSKWN